MAEKENRPVRWQELEEEDRLKYEIAGELGLLDRVMEQGWKSLSSKETGRIGGLVARRRRREEKN
ncbi:small, acid-soluble spore protein, alpha/beta type [uncultured Merdimonas sp.]|uniref:small, acid-soluble spore protein, alpha/beta type n=1 Tax=uncultured Merdimonas sp. TaxID=2023269 RepID=UPI003208492F